MEKPDRPADRPRPHPRMTLRSDARNHQKSRSVDQGSADPSDLRARPLFARRRDSIEAHLTIVFTALAIGRTVQDRTGLSLRRVLRQLRPLRSATIQANGAIQTLPPALGDDELAVLDDLKQASSRH